MGDMAALWGYHEESDEGTEQLAQKLLLTTLELEKLKSETADEMIKNKDHISRLILLLKHALHERDQAKSQLNNLLIQLLNNNSNTFPAKTNNSSITESNSLHSPADSLFDGVVVSSSSTDHHPTLDRGSLVVDEIARGKPLPQKGKFLQAVVRAGPLLQTLLVAGPLPRWRNPPRFDPYQIPPPLSIRGCDQADLGPRAQFQPTLMDFAGTSNRASGPTIASYASLPKKQRFC